MPDPNSERVTCPSCGKGYRWQFELAGRIVPCKACQTPFIVPGAPGAGLPLEPEPTGEDGLYELDLDGHDEPGHAMAAPPIADKCPSCNIALKSGAVICMNCGFSMAEGRKMQTAIAPPIDTDGNTLYEPANDKALGLRPDEPDVLRQHYRAEFILPIGLLTIGGVVAALDALVIAQASPVLAGSFSFIEIALGTMIYILLLAVGTVVGIVIGMALLLKIYGSGFGDARTALLKVGAIALSSAALVVCGIMLFENFMASQGASYTGYGTGRILALIRLLVTFGVCFPAMKLFFEADKIEANVVVIAVLVLSMVFSMFGPAVFAAYF